MSEGQKPAACQNAEKTRVSQPFYDKVHIYHLYMHIDDTSNILSIRIFLIDYIKVTSE